MLGGKLRPVNRPAAAGLLAAKRTAATMCAGDTRHSMLISKKMNEAINRQICYEFSAMLQYVAIASHFVEESVHQLAAYFYRQADEERDHAMRFVKYLLDAGGHVEVGDIPAPQNRFKT